ncbi:tetratricopeptide repeat protein [Sorangium sp. So ce260]|uniref:tetratricopeptide repeat protein n=1 Tax=Sorangium sp. So ce260 TaxID=3133291 RepID=UPI003F5DE0AC
MTEAEGRGGGGEAVDVLIVTAVKEEYDAALLVNTGAWPGCAWEKRRGPTGLEVAFRTFRARDGSPVRVALTRALEMGGVATTNATVPLLNAYEPRCVAMCGVCAGRRGDVQLGDVIVADRLWTYDTGASVVETDDQGREMTRFKADPFTYNLDAIWKHAAESFRPDDAEAWLKDRPRSNDDQGDWLLARLLAGEDPRSHPERPSRCADFAKVVQALRKRGWLTPSGLCLADAGRAYIDDKLLLHPDGMPEREPFAVRVGPIGTGTQVIRDPHLFDKLSERMRKVLGLEMEAAAIGAIAHLHGVERMIVMKGVMDHADPEKSDTFKAFAARASAECLIAFLRANLRPAPPEVGDILVPGTPKEQPKPSPAGLLNARHEHVPFFVPGRAALLEDLRAWCSEPDEVGIQLLYGAGGMGKTRLFIHFCQLLRAEGWAAGFLIKEAETARFQSLIHTWRPTLVVIDYAESRTNLGALLRIVARRRGGQGAGPLRIVLLSRAVGGWWDTLIRRDAEVGDLLRDAPLRELAPLAAVSAARDDVFREAAARFATVLGKGIPGAVPSLDDPRFDRVLYVHMAALAAVNGREVKADQLLQDTLEHEERFWWSQASVAPGEPEQDLFIEKCRRAVTAFTLAGGATTRDDAEEMLGRLDPPPDKAMLRLLHHLYPGDPTGAGAAGYVGRLEPDLLGEGMVLRTLKAERTSAGRFLDRVFQGASEEALRTGFTVLGHLSEENPEEARGWTARVLDRDVPGRAVAALQAAKAVGKRTAYGTLGPQLADALAREGTVELAARIETELWETTGAVGAGSAASRSAGSGVSLRAVAAWVMETRLNHLPASEEPKPQAQRARLLSDLGATQYALGQQEAALASTQEAVEQYRELAAAQPEAFLPNLAMAITNLGAAQGARGQRGAALVSTQEAVDIRRKLAAAQPEAFLPDLAMALTNLGNMHVNLGQREAALASAQEAVDILRKLAAAQPGAFLPDLAMTLTNLGWAQSALGQQEAALASTQEAVDIRRKLAAARPAAFLPDLATAITNLGNIRSALGQRGAARASTQEAADILRKLAAAQPEAFLPNLAIAINNVGKVQSELGEWEAALASTQEAVDILRKLAVAQPEAFLPNLATSLNNLGHMQSELGEREAALASTQEAVDIRRKLAAALPGAFLLDLAASLNHLGVTQSALGQQEAALASTQEAVDIFRKLAAAQPETFLPDVAARLNNLGATQSELGEWEAALASTREAVDIFRKLAAAQPETFLPDLAASLNNLGAMQIELGEWEAALASTQEAVEQYRKLAVAQPEAFLPYLATSLNNLGHMQSQLGEWGAALASTQEAVSIRTKLAAAQPEAFQLDLAQSLNALAAILQRSLER